MGSHDLNCQLKHQEHQASVLNCRQHHACINAPGEYYCSGSCYQVSCATLALLKASGAPSVLLSTEAKTVVNSSYDLVLTYATPVAFNLLPCSSSGEPVQRLEVCRNPCHAWDCVHVMFASSCKRGTSMSKLAKQLITPAMLPCLL